MKWQCYSEHSSSPGDPLGHLEDLRSQQALRAMFFFLWGGGVKTGSQPKFVLNISLARVVKGWLNFVL